MFFEPRTLLQNHEDDAERALAKLAQSRTHRTGGPSFPMIAHDDTANAQRSKGAFPAGIEEPG
jgi:hypothetical protein